MGLEDIAKGAKKDQKEDDKEELEEELGVENVEDLERLDDRLSSMVNSLTTQDQEIEELENEINILKSALATALREIKQLKGEDIEMSEGEKPTTSEIKHRWQ